MTCLSVVCLCVFFFFWMATDGLASECFPTRLSLVTSDAQGWSAAEAIIRQRLCGVGTTFADLAQAIHELQTLNRGAFDPTAAIAAARAKDCAGLRRATEEVFPEPMELYGRVLPFVVERALELPRYLPWLPTLRTGVPGAVVLERRLVLSLLANVFLCNHKDMVDQCAPEQCRTGPGRAGHWCTLDWYLVYASDSPVAVARIACFLAYFAAAERAAAAAAAAGRLRAFLPGALSVERCVGDAAAAARAAAGCLRPFAVEDVLVHTAGMDTEALCAYGVVDFANRDLHVGCVCASATQEEVLFSTRPELFAALCVVDRLGDSDVLVLNGAPALCVTAGHLATFRYAAPVDDADAAHAFAAQTDRPVYAIDAVTGDQFSRAAVLRDYTKAFVAFSHARAHAPAHAPVTVSTGSWGCGAFGGDRLLKFLQQVLAARAAGITLAYSALNDPRYASQLQDAVDRLVAARMRVCDLWRVLTGFRGRDAPAFHKYILAHLGIRWTL